MTRRPAPEAWNADLAADIIARHDRTEGPLLPILHDLQAAFGHVPAQAVALIAAALNLSRAEVHGVVSFYHDFRAEPAGRTVVKLCRAEACQARGGRELQAAAERMLGAPMGATTPDGAVTLEPVYCLGLCASGPAALVDNAPVARLTPERLGELLGLAVA